MIEHLEDFINDGKINIMNVSELTKNMRSSCGPVKTSVARAISGFKIDIAAIEASLNESTRASSESLKAIEDALLLLQNRCNSKYNIKQSVLKNKLLVFLYRKITGLFKFS